MTRLAVLGPLAAAALLCGGCGGGNGGGATGTTTTTTAGSARSCADVANPGPRSPGPQPRPAPLAAGTRWTLTFRTSCGSFAVLLAPKTSPHAAASLVALARAKYFDGTVFHRIVPGFVIQGGDPTQSGSGGPGYSTLDTPGPGTRYDRGVVAMAKTAAEAPGTAGSQFFVMTAAAPSLPPDYAVVGKVVAGLPVVERIGELGDPADPNGTPTKTVVIERVTVTAR